MNRVMGVMLLLVGLLVPLRAGAATDIVYWDFIKPGDGTPRGDALAKNLERFQAKYPDIRLKVEVVPPFDGQKYALPYEYRFFALRGTIS